MKKLLITCFLLFSIYNYCQAQDILITTDGTEIKSKILEILPEEIRYKPFENQDSSTITVLKKDVFMIKYENGTKDVFYKEEEKPEQTASGNYKLPAADMYLKGQADAAIHYNKPGPFIGSFVTTFLFVPAGVITATAISLTPPKPHNLNIRDKTLLNNRDYYDGYMYKAKRKKAGQAWLGAGAGFAALLLFSFVISE